MKKIDKSELLEILKNRGEKTYKEIAIDTGYHEKSLIRLSKQIKDNNYNVEHQAKGKKPNNYIKPDIRENIITLYKQDADANYKDIFNQIKDTYKVSYAFVCRLLNEITNKSDKEILIISKYVINSVNYFAAIDYQTEQVLMISSMKAEDEDMTINILKNIIPKYGAPGMVVFNNIFDEIPAFFFKVLGNYKIKIIEKARDIETIINIKKKVIKKLEGGTVHNIYNLDNIKYNKVDINREDFYYHAELNLISNGILDFNNKRYRVETNKIIPVGSLVDLFYTNLHNAIYIIYNGEKHYLQEVKKALV